MELIQEMQNKIKSAVESLGLESSAVSVVYSARPELCDFQCNSLFQIAKQAGKNPVELGEQIIEKLVSDENFEFSFAKPAFINIKVSNKRLSDELNTRNKSVLLGVKQDKNPQTVVMDYGGANVAKELHIGHLRSPIIGEALARLYRLMGHKVIVQKLKEIHKAKNIK